MSRRVWEYTSVPIMPEDRLVEVLSSHGANGWEAWHITRHLHGQSETVFERQMETSEHSEGLLTSA
jgi:hypothetical protein